MNTRQQGTHFWFMALAQFTPGRGVSTHFRSDTCTPEPGATRLDMFKALLAQVERDCPELAGAAVTAFDIQPNHL
jgi:hypothetical protein